jgi:microsomal dipeptidase-like Zn-dependent dipeptidase
MHYLKIDPECKHLGIGTDFFGTDPVYGLETYGGFQNLAAALRQNGISDETIGRIFHKNAYDFL